MAVISCMIGEIMDAPLIDSWERYCKRHGVNEWCINEGLATRSTAVTISVEEAKEYGLID